MIRKKDLNFALVIGKRDLSFASVIEETDLHFALVIGERDLSDRERDLKWLCAACRMTASAASVSTDVTIQRRSAIPAAL